MKYKNKYPFLIRLFLLPPCLVIGFFLWLFIGLVSDQALGEVFKKTGENFLKDE